MREGHHQSDEHWNCFKGNVKGNVLETGWSTSFYGLFSSGAVSKKRWVSVVVHTVSVDIKQHLTNERAHGYHLELN